jgi:PAS domain S-box-containing protein
VARFQRIRQALGRTGAAGAGPAPTEERFRQAFEGAAIGMALVAPGGELLEANAALAAMLGHSEDSLERSRLADVVHPQDLALVLEHVRAALGNGPGSFNLEIRLLGCDGATSWALLSATLVRDERGAPLHFFAHAQETTARRTAEEALRRRDAILEAVGAAAGLLLERPLDDCADEVLRLLGEATRVSRVYIFEYRGEGSGLVSTLRHEWVAEGIVPSSANPLWVEFPFGDCDFGGWLETFHRGELYQGKIRDLPPEERRVLEDEGVLSILEAPVFVGGELWGDVGFDDCREERDWLPAEMDAVRAAAGLLGAAIGRERAERRLGESEELLLQSQKMEAVGRLAGGIAHDFNNLLTVITGYSGLALDQLGNGHALRRDIEQIADAATRAVTVTGQLLAFSRRQMLQPRAVDLNVVVRETESLLRRLIGEDIELVTRLEPGLAYVFADPGQLEQVILNLAVNARDAMPRGGTLTLATKALELGPGADAPAEPAPGHYAALTVTDTGHGMDDDTRGHVFEPFFTTKEKGKGTGLGLATAYGIVKQTGGDITVDSQPGRGTTFTIALPVDTSGARLPEARPDREHARGGVETILLAEDEELVRDLITEMLELRGYTVLSAGDGIEALDVAAEHSGAIDLLVTDVVMPRLSGRELAEHVARDHPGMRVLYISGYTDDAVLRHGVLEAHTPFLQKPFTAEALARAVRVAIDVAAA